MSAGFCCSTLVHLEHSTICIDSGFGCLYQSPIPSGVPRNFFFGGGCSTNSVEDRENGDLGAVASYPLVKGSGGSCNLVQEISFHIVKFS